MSCIYVVAVRDLVSGVCSVVTTMGNALYTIIHAERLINRQLGKGSLNCHMNEIRRVCPGDSIYVYILAVHKAVSSKVLYGVRSNTNGSISVNLFRLLQSLLNLS